MQTATLIIATLTLAAAIPAGWYAWRTSRRDTKRADVGWRVVQFGSDGVRIIHLGRDTAYEVGISLVIDDAEHLQHEQPEVARGTNIELRSNQLHQATIAIKQEAEDEEQARAEAAQRTEARGSSLNVNIPEMFIPSRPFLPVRLSVKGQITWRSRGRRWDHQAIEETFTASTDD